MRGCAFIVIGSIASLVTAPAFGQSPGSGSSVPPPVTRSQVPAPVRDLTGTIALTAPSSHFTAGQPATAPQPPAPAPPGLQALPAQGVANAVPRVIPLEPPPGENRGVLSPAAPRVIRFPADATGLSPERLPLSSPGRSVDQVSQDLTNIVELIKDPEAEISLVEGQTKIIQTRRELTRIVIANPAVADVELLSDQPAARLLNVYGKTFGTTSLTIWDQTNRPVSFLVRVSLDTSDLSLRIRQAFPGAEIKVCTGWASNHSGWPGAGLEDDSRHPSARDPHTHEQPVIPRQQRWRGWRRHGDGWRRNGRRRRRRRCRRRGRRRRGRWWYGRWHGWGRRRRRRGRRRRRRGARSRHHQSRHHPGAAQILLHVKIAEINRSATRSIGVSWVYARGQSIFGSAAGNNALMTFSANTAVNQGTGSRGFAQAPQQTVGATNLATPSGSAPLFGVFNSGHFSLFIDALRTNSLAKILAEPNLVALDGVPARFLVGGLFPFPVPQSSSVPGGTAVVTVQFQRFGTILTFLPEILPNDVIRLDVEPVISQLDFASGTTVNGGKVPAIDERSARTVVELREGQTLAIAGLLQSLTNATTNRIPGLGDLPIVGSWFSANSIETIETETIVLVTPELVSPLEKREVTEAPGDRVFQPNDPEFYLLGRIEGKLGREFRATKGEQDPLNIMKHYQSEQQWVIGQHGHAD